MIQDLVNKVCNGSLTIHAALEAAVASVNVLSEVDSHYKEFINQNVFIRTVTYHLAGKLLKVTDKEFVLTKAAWIADSGRYMQAITSANFDEVEPYPENSTIIVGRSALIDMVIIPSLPREQK